MILCGDRPVVRRIAYDDAPETLLEILEIACKAQHRHDLACDGDVVAVLARDAVCLSAETDRDLSERTVVHVDAALPDDLGEIQPELIALVDMVVDHGGKQIVRRADRMEIAGEVQVDILHRNDLRIASARRAALDAEHGTETRLTQSGDRAFSETGKRVRKPDRGGRFAFARGGRRDRGDKDQFAVASGNIFRIDLCLVSAVRLDGVRRNARFFGDFADGKQRSALRDLNISQHGNPPVYPEQMIPKAARSVKRTATKFIVEKPTRLCYTVYGRFCAV